MDLRGTGRSGRLRCKAFEQPGPLDMTEAGARCAAELGSRRGFYTARESAADVESLRQALGVERIALIGSEYGARVALAYARLHPDQVERLVLALPPPPAGEDPLYRSGFGSIPDVVRDRCRERSCRLASRTPVADVVALARRLEQGPLNGPVVDARGHRHVESIGPFDLYEALGGGAAPSTQLLPETEAVPLVRNARRGDLAPLLKARQIARWWTGHDEGLHGYVYPAHAASVCEESALPWPPTLPVPDRAAHVSGLALGLPNGAFAPFGPRTALASDILDLCERWPVASAPPAAPGVLSNVPTLILAGDESLSSPPAYAEATARLIPGARVLHVPGPPDTEHDLSLGSCTQPALASFFHGRSPAACGRAEYRRSASRAAPLSLSEVDPDRDLGGRPGRTLAAVRMTLRDGAGLIAHRFFVRLFEVGDRRLRLLYGAPLRAGALRKGAYRLGFRHGRFALRRASYVPGVMVSGAIAPPDYDRPSRRRGSLRVSGPAAARGRLTLRGRLLRGRLGGRLVQTSLGRGTYPDLSYGD